MLLAPFLLWSDESGDSLAHLPHSASQHANPLAVAFGIVLVLASQTALYLAPEGVWQPALAGLWALAVLHLALVALGGVEVGPKPAVVRVRSPASRDVADDDFDERVCSLLASGSSKPQGVALFLIEIEHKERLRDLLGQPAIDEAQSIAQQAVGGLLRQMDAKTKLDDGRFVALLDGMTEPLAADVAERLKVAIEASCLVFEGRLVPLRVGIGVALAARRTTFEALLATAGRALARTRHDRGPGLHLLPQDREQP